jgi:hypothetical protein
MSFIFIGSVAFQSYSPSTRANDVDAIADFETAKAFLKDMKCYNIYPINQGKTLVGKNDKQIYEVSLAWPGTTNAELLKYVGDGGPVPSLDVLYALKMSHRYLRNSPHFYKTMRDINYMRALGAIIPDDLQDWFKRREKETYDYKHPSLAQNKNNFFSGDGVNYIYDHDTIHEAVAILEKRPMYTRYQKDDNEVLCDKNKWDKLPQEYKMMAVAEEAAVLAIERSLVPFPGAKTTFEAFKYALMKVCTSITSGWFREFAWENHDEIINMIVTFEYDFWGLFQEALKQDRIKPFKGN